MYIALPMYALLLIFITLYYMKILVSRPGTKINAVKFNNMHKARLMQMQQPFNWFAYRPNNSHRSALKQGKQLT